MKEQISAYLNKYVEFDKQEIDYIYSKLVLKTFKKKEYILKSGQICRERFFIVEGLVRSFYIDNKGNEKISNFAIENWWITDIESYVRESPSYSYIQTVENTKILMVSKVALEKLFVSIPKLERFFRIISDNTLIALQRKNDIYMQMNSKERYTHLVEGFPSFAQRVPQYMIASYLEMTPEYLSEIRRK
ncbi:MAG: Crp/Fnr family transcriptional regulator [Flavobacteriaceae bacterium]|nr:Crp/Fnr family transcriptional regulator [Flavobacteriaceae bacterium]